MHWKEPIIICLLKISTTGIRLPVILGSEPLDTKNSQYRSNDITNASISIEPKVFSPDNNGFDDYTSIHYQFPEPGYVCNIRIYDAHGRPVRNLTRNAICGLKGFFPVGRAG